MPPIFEYQCDRCHKKIEVTKSFRDESTEPCPDCPDKPEMKKLISLSSFQLKGDSWASTNYGLKKK